MKSSGWDVLLVVVLLGFVLAAGVWAQALVPTIVGIVSTLVGAFFVNRPKDPSQPDALAPVLKLVPKKDEGDQS